MTLSDINPGSDSASLVGDLYRHYRALEQDIQVNEKSTRTTYRSPVNFIESMQKPRHRWFPYKEGFSPSFVEEFLSTGLHIENGLVMDPFSGSGTTALVAGELGFRGLGFDVSPLTDFVAKTKAISMNANELRTLKGYLLEFENSSLDIRASNPKNATVERYFETEVLDALLKAKEFFNEIDCPKTSSLFKLAFLTAIEPFSTHRKAGNGVKRKTNYSWPTPETDSVSAVKRFIVEKLGMFAADIEQTPNFHPPEFLQKSCLGDKLPDDVEDVGAVLTSPPYANCFDYSKIYMSELWLGDFFASKEDQRAFRQASVRSHVHATWAERYSEFGVPIVDEVIRPHIEEQDLWSPRIGSMLSGYFADLGNLLTNLKPRMRNGGKLGFVVGNSFYGGVAVATDLLLAELGRSRGYEVEEIRVYRGIIPSSQQFRKLGNNRKYMRESMVVLRRP
ncbi:DNA methyltransferase [uncultured Aliiroseovarius sp.]|uniref:DNA methyltransferase n=1 Tax=uncultured Aliiroseovarius sp. TaxID=1658783 RepID=UPI0026089143|nr:DNA methyltransferase [uncultured Aliiroseovarius sp.]